MSPTDKPQGKDKQEKLTRMASFFQHEGKLYEEVYQGGECLFACWDGKELTYVDSVDTGHEVVIPFYGEEIRRHLISLPEQACEYGDELTLATEIREYIHKYVDIPPLMEEVATGYVLMTWVYDKLSTVCYLRFLGDYGSGKSRVETTAGRICYKAMFVSGATTTAPIFRLIDRYRGTLIIDEADWKDSGEQADIVKILNSGFEAGTPVMRCDANNPDRLLTFDTFGPKIIASRRSFWDQALESRCLRIVMEETERDDLPANLPAEIEAEQRAIRNKLLMFRFRNLEKIKVEQISLPVTSRRLLQGFQPMAQIMAKVSPAALERFKSFLAQYERELVEDKANSSEGLVVNALCQLIEEDKDLITPSAIAERIGRIAGKQDHMSAPAVGRILATLKMRTRLRKMGKETRRVVPVQENANVLKKLKRKYVPAAAEPDQGGEKGIGGFGGFGGNDPWEGFEEPDSPDPSDSMEE